MFRHLCGTDAYPNVVVLTTFWDSVSNVVGTNREEELRTTAFRDLLQGGAQFMRHDRTLESALKMVGRILTFTPRDIRIVEEIRKEGKALEETEAGSVRREEVERLVAKHKQEVKELKAQMAAVRGHNEAMRREMKEEKRKLQQQLARWETERAELKKGLEDKESLERWLHERNRAEREEVQRLFTQHRDEVKAEMATIRAHNERMRRELEEKEKRLQEQSMQWDTERGELQRALGNERNSRQQVPVVEAEAGQREKESTDRVDSEKENEQETPPVNAPVPLLRQFFQWAMPVVS
jgi:chromosome segregation ATPase